MELSGATRDFDPTPGPLSRGGGTPLQAKLEGSEDLRRRSEAAERRSKRSPRGLTRRGDGEFSNVYSMLVYLLSAI